MAYETQPFKFARGDGSTRRPTGVQTEQERERQSLDSAIRLVDSQFNKELGESALDNCLHSQRVEYERDLRFPQFVIEHFYNFPIGLVQALREVQVRTLGGFFTEIRRAWVIVDNKLYIWKYDERENFMVIERPHLIVSVAIVPPKPSIFSSEVRNILVISTAVEVILCIIINDNQDDISIETTEYVVPNDNVQMIKIDANQQGRIFMCAIDGNLYEFIYQANESFFQKKCRIECLTSSFIFRNIMPSFIVGQNKSLVDITIDRSRNILYTLTDQKWDIQVFNLGAKGDQNTLIYNFSQVFEAAKRQIVGIKPFNIVKISAITENESANFCLVALTNTGFRLFFSSFQDIFLGNNSRTSG